jgi:flagellar biosynthesis/type III secretory pathway protein FliH
LTLRLNPKDIDTVKDFQQDLLPDDDVSTDLRLEADETIQRGGCIIETKLGDVDAQNRSTDQDYRRIADPTTSQTHR